MKPPWRVMFFGTDDFALGSLKMLFTELSSQRLVQDLRVVCAQRKCSVAKFSNQNNLKLIDWKPEVEQITESGSHIGLVASFGHLIPSKIISAFPLGMLNVHASLLPRWRGAAPIVHAVLNRDKITGTTIMRIRPHKFDEGEIISNATCEIGEHDTAFKLTKKLSLIGAEELRKCLENLPESLATATAQTNTEVTYAPKIGPWMSVCDWVGMTSAEVYARHLALNHVYPLQTTWQNQPLKILECVESQNISSAPGNIVFDWKLKKLLVACKDNTAIAVNKIKLPGKPSILAIDFLNGYLNRISRDLWRFGEEKI